MDLLYNNILSDFFLWCLNGMNGFFNNYAASIVVLTILIRLCMLPLDLKSRGNQAKMSALGPQIQSLQKRYKNNPQQIQRKTQELYRKNKVRPMFGCLPMLIQMPFLFAFFGAMRVLAAQEMVGMVLEAAQFGAETVQLPSFLWVHNFWLADSGLQNIMPNASEFLTYVQQNISWITPETMSLLRSHDLLAYSDGVMQVTGAYEPLAARIIAENGLTGYRNGWFILPVLAGVALWLQQKFSPQQANGQNAMMGAMPQDDSPEAQQAQGCNQKVMMWVMPIFSVWICLTGNTAFTLYWLISSVYAFTQGRIIDYVRKKNDKGTEIIVS